MRLCSPAGTAIEALWREQVTVGSVFKMGYSTLLHEHDSEPYALEYGPIIAVAQLHKLRNACCPCVRGDLVTNGI